MPDGNLPWVVTETRYVLAARCSSFSLIRRLPDLLYPCLDGGPVKVRRLRYGRLRQLGRRMAKVHGRHRSVGRQGSHVGARIHPSPSRSGLTDFLHTLQLEGKRNVLSSSMRFLTFVWLQNWLYRSDDFMMSQKLEQLMCIRNQLDQIEIISWNDVSLQIRQCAINGLILSPA
jgi:hypothetical protein